MITRSWGACIVAILLFATTAFAWETRIRRATQAWRVASAPDGGVFTTVPFPVRGYEGTVGVVKLSSRGHELWRRSLAGRAARHSDEVNALVTTADGDVVAAGALSTGKATEFGVTRLSGRSGRPRWRRVIQGPPLSGSYHEALSLALDPAGDLVAAGELQGVTTGPERSTTDLAVVKLAGDSGEERWRYVLDGATRDFDRAQIVAVDARGDVIVLGRVVDHDALAGDYASNLTILKLAGADGRLLWRTPVTSSELLSLSLDAAGSALVAGTPHDGDATFGVVKIDGATGRLVWTAALAGDPEPLRGYARGAIALPSGDVAAVGFTVGDLAPRAFTAAAFDGATGVERWRRLVVGSDGLGVGSSIAVGPTGNVVAGGILRNTVSCYDVAILELASSTGETISTHTFDGTTTATACDVPEGEEPCRFGCPFTGRGIDQDALDGLTVDPQGRIDAIGVLSDGHRGRPHAFATQLTATP